MLVLTWLLLAIAAVLYGLWRAVRRWPLPTLGALLSMGVAATWAVSALQRDFSYHALPTVVRDGKVLYRNEFDSSIPFFPLPGDNETGVIVYSISADDAAALERSIAAAAPTNQGIPNRGGRHDFYDWRRTPASLWHDERAQDARLQGIAPFLDQYGFGITLEPWVESLINVILSREGSYIARSRVGLLIFSPSRQRIIYAYAG